MVKLYGLKNCDSCRKAKKALEGEGREVEFVDVRATPLSADEIAIYLDAFGEDKLVNKKSTTWRQLGVEDREKPALDLLLANPSLMKRPLIVDGDKLWLGWTKDVQADLIG
jgi:Spx/MgsR family transcriptional regulator